MKTLPFPRADRRPLLDAVIAIAALSLVGWLGVAALLDCLR